MPIAGAEWHLLGVGRQFMTLPLTLKCPTCHRGPFQPCIDLARGRIDFPCEMYHASRIDEAIAFDALVRKAGEAA